MLVTRVERRPGPRRAGRGRAGRRAPSCALAAVCGTGTETTGKFKTLKRSCSAGSNVWRLHPDVGLGIGVVNGR